MDVIEEEYVNKMNETILDETIGNIEKTDFKNESVDIGIQT